MDIQRGHERERSKADIAPDNYGRRSPRFDEPTVGQADQNEGHCGRALHDCACESPQSRSEQRRMRCSLDDVAEARSVKPAQILSDETQAQKKQPQTQNQRVGRRHFFLGT